MKVLKFALIACSFIAAAAHAQTAPEASAASSESAQQVAQANLPRAGRVVPQGRVSVPKAKAQECVGPVSFCNIYFGS